MRPRERSIEYCCGTSTRYPGSGHPDTDWSTGTGSVSRQTRRRCKGPPGSIPGGGTTPKPNASAWVSGNSPRSEIYRASSRVNAEFAEPTPLQSLGNCAHLYHMRSAGRCLFTSASLRTPRHVLPRRTPRPFTLPVEPVLSNRSHIQRGQSSRLKTTPRRSLKESRRRARRCAHYSQVFGCESPLYRIAELTGVCLVHMRLGGRGIPD